MSASVQEETQAPFRFTKSGNGLTTSWRTQIAFLVVAFGAGAWATTLSKTQIDQGRQITQFYDNIGDIRKVQSIMQEQIRDAQADLKWLIRHQQPIKDTTAVSAAPAAMPSS